MLIHVKIPSHKLDIDYNRSNIIVRNKTVFLLFLLIVVVVAVTAYNIQSNAASQNNRYQNQIYECQKLTTDDKICQSVVDDLNKPVN